MRKALILLIFLGAFFFLQAYDYDLYYIKSTTKAAAPNVLFLFDKSGSMVSKDVCSIPADPFDELFCADWYSCSNDGNCLSSGNTPYENCICEDFTNYKVANPYCSDYWGDSEAPAGRNDYEYSLSYDLCVDSARTGRLDTLQNAVTNIITELSKTVSEKPVNMGVASFPNGLTMNGVVDQELLPLDNGVNSSTLNSAVNSLTASGMTPMGEGLTKAYSYFLDNQSLLRSCRPNIVILTSDGEPNSNSSNLGVAIDSNVTAAAYRNYLQTMLNPVPTYEQRILKVAEFMAKGSTSLPLYKDLNNSDKGKCVNGLCNFGNKSCVLDSECPSACADGACVGNKVQVFPISFVKNLGIIGEIGKVGNAAQKSYHVGNEEEMVSAVFDSLESVYRAPVSGAAAPAVTVSGDYAGNEVYLSIFQPSPIGHWWGNIRKYCVFNDKGVTNGNCLFQYKDPVLNTTINQTPNEKNNIKEILLSKKNIEGELDQTGNLMISSLGVNERLQSIERKIYYTGSFTENIMFDNDKPSCSDEPCTVVSGQTIPDGGFTQSYNGVSSQIEVKNYNNSPYIELVKITASISHARPSTLYMKLTSPSKRDIYLDHIIIPDVSVSDASVVNSDASDVVFTKVIDRKSLSALPNWVKEDINGKWTLSVYDRKYGDGKTGKLNSWSIQFFQAGTCGDGKLQGHAEIVRDTASKILKSYKSLPAEVCDGGTKSCAAIDNTRFSGGNAICLSDCSGYDLSTCTKVASPTYKKLVPAHATSDYLKRVYNFMNGYEDKVATNTSDGTCLITSAPKYDCYTSDCIKDPTPDLEADQYQSITLSFPMTFGGKVDNIKLSFNLRREYNNDFPPTFTATYQNDPAKIRFYLKTPSGVEKKVDATATPATGNILVRNFSIDTNLFKGEQGNGLWTIRIKNDHDTKKIKLADWKIGVTPEPPSATDYLCLRRKNIAGDFWHATSLIVDNYIIAGSNAGFLSVFNANNGTELKAVVPSTDILLNHITRNYAKSTDKAELFGPDVSPLRIKGGTFDYIWDAFGRGGNGFVIYTKDSLITDNTEPVVKFEDSGNHNLVMSQPQYISWGNTDKDPSKCTGCTDYLVLSAGYHKDFDINDKTNKDAAKNSGVKKGVKWYSVASDGTIAAAAMSQKTEPSSFRLSEKSPVVAAPLFFNSKIDEYIQDDYKYFKTQKKNVDSLYFVDLIGEIFYMNSSDNTLYSVFSLPQTMDKNSEDLNTFGRPAVINRTSKKQQWVYIGTGDATRPVTGISGNVVAGIKHLDNSKINKGITSFANLYNATPDMNFDTGNGSKYNAADINDLCSAGGCATNDPYGWYFTLPPNSSVSGNMVSYNKRLYFTVFVFDPIANLNTTECSLSVNPGRSYLYEVNAFSGRPVRNYQPDDTKDDRIMTDLGPGLASEPVLAVDDKGNPRLFITKGPGELEVVDIQKRAQPLNPSRILWWKIY